MKCPKCGYLGFETVDRCRNCGYDFSLSVPSTAATELPLRARDGGGAPLADLDLDLPDRTAQADDAGLDLDRLIGSDAPADEAAPPPRTQTPAADRLRTPSSPSTPGSHAAAGRGLPLFAPAADTDDTPLITAPRPVRPPLSVRRATPDVPRVRPRATRPRPDDAALNFQHEAQDPEAASDTSHVPIAADTRAGSGARVAAMLVDLALLAGIDGAVLYLTLAIAGLPLTWLNIGVLPAVPTAAFLLLLNGGYLVAFTAAGGQTIGKMLTGIRVTSEEGSRVDVGRAVVRAAGCLLSLLTVGLAYLPAFASPDSRALHDRLARTRVVRAR